MGILADYGNTPQPMVISDIGLTDLLLDNFMKQVFATHTDGQIFDWRRYLTRDEKTILYRRTVIEELSANESLIAKLHSLCQSINTITHMKNENRLSEYGPDAFREFGLMQEIYYQMHQVTDTLGGLIREGKIKSGALLDLQEQLKEKIDHHFNNTFAFEWERYATGIIESLGSMRIRFRLNDELQVEGATLESLNQEKYGKRSSLEKTWNMDAVKTMETPTEDLLRALLQFNQRGFMKIMGQLTLDMDDLYQDLIFYLGALEYCQMMKKASVAVSFPTLAPGKVLRAVNLINPVLVLMNPGKSPVGNDVNFSEESEIFLLTGINQGGKTTYLRSVGILQLFTQLGWPVAAEEATVSLVDRIVTVFSHKEDTGLQQGKLGQELSTMKKGLMEATRDSLFLCNEPITGTSPMENLYLSRIILTSCKLNGYKGIWVTHLYDLAARAPQMNQQLSGSKITSLVAKVILHGEDVEASYRIEPGEPAFTSYARQVLAKEAARK